MKRNKGLVIALLASLVGNGILLGIYFGQQYSGKDRWAMREMSHKLLKDSPSEFADMLRQAMYEHKGEMRSSFRALRQTRWEMVDLLKQESVSQAELQAGFAKVRAADDKLKGEVHSVLAEVLPGVPVEHRLELAKWQDKKMRRSHKGNKGDRLSPSPSSGHDPE